MTKANQHRLPADGVIPTLKMLTHALGGGSISTTLLEFIMKMKVLVLLAVLLVVVPLVIGMGYLGIWVFNTLFPVLAIKYGFWEVLAMILFLMIFAPKDSVKVRR